MNRRLILALAPAIALSSPALAQAPRQGPGPHHAPPADMAPMRQAMMKQHVDDLKTVLRLRPDQEAALQAFVAAHHPPRKEGMDRSGAAEAPGTLTTPQRLDRMARRDADRAARHAQRREALSKFYAALSPDQQKVFDALMRLQRPGHRGRHMGMMMGGPMGHHGPD
jgi:hypothetical protein